jgi:hypothetical protein
MVSVSKKEMNTPLLEYLFLNISDKKEIVSYCIQALEECHRRFPEHFKSLYRMAYHYFHSSTDRDVDKARAILLGDNGLFRARKQKDFFKVKNKCR